MTGRSRKRRKKPTVFEGMIKEAASRLDEEYQETLLANARSLLKLQEHLTAQRRADKRRSSHDDASDPD